MNISKSWEYLKQAISETILFFGIFDIFHSDI